MSLCTSGGEKKNVCISTLDVDEQKMNRYIILKYTPIMFLAENTFYAILYVYRLIY